MVGLQNSFIYCCEHCRKFRKLCKFLYHYFEQLNNLWLNFAYKISQIFKLIFLNLHNSKAPILSKLRPIWVKDLLEIRINSDTLPIL